MWLQAPGTLFVFALFQAFRPLGFKNVHFFPMRLFPFFIFTVLPDEDDSICRHSQQHNVGRLKMKMMPEYEYQSKKPQRVKFLTSETMKGTNCSTPMRVFTFSVPISTALTVDCWAARWRVSFFYIIWFDFLIFFYTSCRTDKGKAPPPTHIPEFQENLIVRQLHLNVSIMRLTDWWQNKNRSGLCGLQIYRLVSL